MRAKLTVTGWSRSVRRTTTAANDTADTAMAANAATGTASPDSMGAMAGMNHDSMGGMNHGAMANMTGDPDRDFLRMMSDHHKGLVAMAHPSVEGDKKGSAAMQAEARKLDKAQDAELDVMVTKLETQYKDPYGPKVMPDAQTMVDQLKAQSGAAYERAFYENVVKHHQQAIQMIDGSLPKLKDGQIKAMAEEMKRDQTREITEFQQKAAKS